MVEKENFNRLCGIMLNIGAKVLREVFLDKYVGTNTLVGYLAVHKKHLIRLIPNPLRKNQFDILYPSRSGAPIIEDLDITLLCLLFRHLDTQTTPNDSVWFDPKTLQTYQADITRIRLARNKTFHVTSASVSNTIYTNEVSNLTTIFHRLVQSLSAGRMTSTKLAEMMDGEINGPLQINDRDVKHLKEELQEWYRHDEGFRKTLETSQEEPWKYVKELYEKQENNRKDLNNIKKQFSEKQENMKRDIKHLQEGQLVKSRQWDSLIRKSRMVVMDEMWKRIDHSKEVLDKHRCHAGEFFIENQRYRKGKKILDQHGKIFITGNPGQGKTYLAYQLLVKFLEDKKTVSPLIISSADEWMRLADSSTELGIVVDDMCGKYGLLQGELKNWNENARFITALVDKRKHTVIFTMRTHIYEETLGGLHLESDISDRFCFRNMTLNLENDSMNLTEADKINFANRYLKEFAITEDEVLQLCRINEASVGFPLLCRAAQSIEDKAKLFDLFTRPLEIMLLELECLLKDKSISYGSLVLAMLSGGTLTLESINEYSATSDRKKDVKLIFDSYAGPDVKLADIQQAANTLCGTYLLFSETDESYSFIHDVVEEAVFLSYGKLHLKETLKYCSLRSVCKLCRINDESYGSKVQKPVLMLDLRPVHHGILIERFIKALETKFPTYFATISEANVWSSDEFRKLFMDKCKMIHALADTDQNALLVHAANANNCDLAIELLHDIKRICAENQQQAISYLTKAAKASCVHKDICLFKQFIKTGNVNGNDILSSTVEKGSEEAVVFLLQNGADINLRSKNGESLLHIACLHGRLDMVKLLLSKNSVLVNQCDSNGRSVCHSAASGGSVDILNILVQKGADPSCTDVERMNILQYACLEGKKEMVFHLMDTYSNMLGNVGKGGYTVLHCAVHGGNIDIFKMLWKKINVPSQTDYNSYSEEEEAHHQKQAFLKARAKTGETLLHISCIAGQLGMTQYLVEKYPDMIKEVNICKQTLAHYAVQSSNISVLQYLIGKGLDPWCRTATQETLLHMSCITGQLEMTRYLVEKYPDMINEVDNCNGTPAHCAAQSGNVSVLKYLISQGIDPWCRTATQKTLLYSSCIAGRLEMTKYLVEKYPDMINKLDNCKGTPAHYAAYSGNVSVLGYIIDQGQNPWCRTAVKETLLHNSCIAGQLEMTKYLVEKYPGMINEVDNCKRTSAHYAAYSSNVSLLQYLIGQGLDPWCRTATQETLLHISCIAGQLEMTQYLVETYPDMIKEVDSRKETPAHNAAQSNNIFVLQYVIDKGLDPYCRTSTQETLLHQSCIAGQLEMTQYLVEKYPDMINEVNICNETLTHFAVQSSNVSMLQYLIDKGLDPYCRTSRQETLLHMSCIDGQLEMTRYLVEKYPDMISEVSNCKETPAYHAAQSGNVSVLQYLIGQGLDPYCRTSAQQTLLHISCIAGQLEMTMYLVKIYPNMFNVVDSCKQTPAHNAAQSSNVSVLQYIIDQGIDPWCRTSTQKTLLHQSCIAGQLETTQYLAEKYPDMIYQLDDCENTPAQYAAQSSNISVLQYLIGQGLDPWFKTPTQQTLLHMSCMAGQFEMIQYLVKKYPDMISKVDNCKETPAHYAAYGGNIFVLQYLVSQGIDPWCKTSSQETLLHLSCVTGQLEMTQYLVEKYPDMIHEVDNCKQTPGYCAVWSRNISVLEYLIGIGLNPWCRTTTQETLLHKSCIMGQLEMTRYLAETFPDMINTVDNCKRTPAHNAAYAGNVSLLQYLINQGIDPWCKTVTQESLLHRSCINGRLEMTQYLVKKYPDMIKETVVKEHQLTMLLGVATDLSYCI